MLHQSGSPEWFPPTQNNTVFIPGNLTMDLTMEEFYIRMFSNLSLSRYALMSGILLNILLKQEKTATSIATTQTDKFWIRRVTTQISDNFQIHWFNGITGTL